MDDCEYGIIVVLTYPYKKIIHPITKIAFQKDGKYLLIFVGQLNFSFSYSIILI